MTKEEDKQFEDFLLLTAAGFIRKNKAKLREFFQKKLKEEAAAKDTTTKEDHDDNNAPVSPSESDRADSAD